MSRRKRIGALDHLLGATLALGYIALLMASSSELAMSRDESFYVVAAERYGAWFEALFEDPSAALEPSAIDREWGYNHEHPALIKSLFALSHLAHSRWDLFADDSMAYRFPAIVLAGLLIWLIYIFGARAYARDAGLFAALSFALLPRVFYHAHLACFDVPIVFLITLVTYCYWRSLTHPSWALWTGLSFGLALATKHNSWVLPGIFGVHFAWMALRERGWRRLDPRGKRVSCVPHWLYAMILLGPMILVLSWPYVWHDTLERLGWYAAFHLRHDYYNMAYFGVNYFRPPFPIGFPFVMAMFTLPATFLLLALTGMLRRVPVLLPARWLARLELRDRIDRSQTDLLFYGSIAAPLLMIALPSSPIFGGTKHWMPAYPFMALFAGLSFALLARSVRRWLGLHPLLARQLLRGLIASLLLLPSALETVHSHPFGLSHYTYLAGGVPGAPGAKFKVAY